MIVVALITVLLSPWHGKALPTTPSGSYETSFALTVRGAPGKRVELRADGVAKGWVAAFCTSRLCAPFRTFATLDKRGTARYEFSLIRTDPSAVKHTHAVIRADGKQVAAARA
jgi:hypothetical protein